MAYPSSDLDSAKTFLSALGSFWSFAFQDNLESVMSGSLELNWQSYINYLEAVASVSRFNIPAFHTKLWNRLLIRKSEVNNAVTSPLTYGAEQARYNAMRQYAIGFYAAQRIQAGVPDTQTIEILINGVVVKTVTPTGDWQGYSIFFSAPPGDWTLQFRGTKASQTAFITFIIPSSYEGSSITVNDRFFEDAGVAAGTSVQAPAGSGWTWSGTAGIATTGSTISSGNAAPPGDAFAYVTGSGSFSQPSRLDEPLPVGYQRLFRYGDSISTTNYRYPIGDNVINAVQVVDRPIKPSVSLLTGVDVKINNKKHYIEFVTDPFASGKFTTRSVINEKTGESDEEIELWLFKSSLDLNLIYEQFGYALGLYFTASSENYKTLLNSVWDSMVVGPTMLNLRVALGAITGAPVVRNDVEVVEKIITDDFRHQQIITDKEVYTFKGGITILVDEGQTVYAGDFLTDSVALAEGDAADKFFADNQDVGIDLDASNCVIPFTDKIRFFGITGLVLYNTDVDGFMTVSFDGVGGPPADIDLFWNTANAKAKAAGKSLAWALRSQPYRTDEPSLEELAEFVSPAAFLVRHVFGNNALLLYIKDYDGLGEEALVHLRKLVPAHVTVLQCTK